MNEQQTNRLSEAGEARRNAMLGELVQVVDRTRRVRRARRLVIASGAALGIVLILSQLQLPDGSPMNPSNRIVDKQATQPESTGAMAKHDSPAGTPAVADIREAPAPRDGLPRSTPREPASDGITTIVRTDPAVVPRYRASPARLVVHLDDAALERTLASIDRPARLIPSDKGLQLDAPVTDEELGLNGRQRGL